jgi:alpha,alpha-trehalose phosphorylase
VEIDQDGARYELLDGPSLTVRHHGSDVRLDKGAPQQLVIEQLPRRDAPGQPYGRVPRRRTPKI